MLSLNAIYCIYLPCENVLLEKKTMLMGRKLTFVMAKYNLC